MTFWKDLAKQLAKHKNLILLVVVESLKSSPGRQGFKMFVAPDNTFLGTIGGGVMEFGFVEKAKKELLQKTMATNYIKRQIHRGTKPESSGMICSGEQTIAFISLNTAHLPIIEDVLKHPNGTLKISANDLVYLKNKPLNSKFSFQKTEDKQWVYSEQIHQKPKLYILGAGHVGAATSKLCQQVGFDVVLLDNRPNLNTFEANTTIVNKHIIDYNTIADHIEEGPHVYIVVMTHGYKGDKIILAALLKKQFKFLGAMGSSVKIKIMFKALLKDGFLQEELDKIQAPLGLFIKSETPNEIAVSVAAQLIKVKNN